MSKSERADIFCWTLLEFHAALVGAEMNWEDITFRIGENGDQHWYYLEEEFSLERLIGDSMFGLRESKSVDGIRRLVKSTKN